MNNRIIVEYSNIKKYPNNKILNEKNEECLICMCKLKENKIMLTKNISLINFQKIKVNKKVSKEFDILKKDFLNKKDKFLLSLSEKYKYSFSKKEIKKYTKFNLV